MSGAFRIISPGERLAVARNPEHAAILRGIATPTELPCPSCKGIAVGRTYRGNDGDGAAVVMRAICTKCAGTGRDPRRCPECDEVAGGIRCQCPAMLQRLELLGAQHATLRCTASDRREIDGRCQGLARVIATTDRDETIARLCALHVRAAMDTPSEFPGLEVSIIPMPPGAVEWWDSAARLGVGF